MQLYLPGWLSHLSVSTAFRPVFKMQVWSGRITGIAYFTYFLTGNHCGAGAHRAYGKMAIHIIAAIGSPQTDPAAISATVIIRPGDFATQHGYYRLSFRCSIIITGMVPGSIVRVLDAIRIGDL